MTVNDPVEDAGRRTTRRPAAASWPWPGRWIPARVRAEKRVQRFLDAALELMQTASGKEFTVQEVVERSGQSLRSFYQYFAGKHELLLALFEEAVRADRGAARARRSPTRTTRSKRLHRFVVEYYRACRPAPTGRSAKPDPAGAMAEFAQQLLTAHPQRGVPGLQPARRPCSRRCSTSAAAAGVIRPEVRNRRMAGVILQAVMFNAFAATISGTPLDADDDAADELWQMVLHGIGTDARAEP